MATYTYDPTQTSLKDEVRFFIGDTKLGGWLPGSWLLADEEIQAVVNRFSTDSWEAKAECALAAGRQAMLGYHKVDQGHRLRIEYNSPEKIWVVFEGMANEARNKMQPDPGAPANPGAITGRMRSPHYSPEGPGRRRDIYEPSTAFPGDPVYGRECD